MCRRFNVSFSNFKKELVKSRVNHVCIERIAVWSVFVTFPKTNLIDKTFPLRQILSLGYSRLYFICALPFHGLLVYFMSKHTNFWSWKYHKIVHLQLSEMLLPGIAIKKALYAWPPGTPTKLHVQDPNLWMLQRRWINVKKTIGLVYRNFWGTQIFGKVSLGQWNKDSSTSEFCRRGKELIDAKTKVGRGMKED